MYYSEQERLERLEKTVAKQAFQIFLLQHIAIDKLKYGIYFDIISTNMEEQTFNALRKLTKQYEADLDLYGYVSMSDFVHQFSKIIINDTPQMAADLASFIPRWLGGVNGGFGFSKTLYTHFYEEK